MKTTYFNKYTTVYPGQFTPASNETMLIKEVKNIIKGKINHRHSTVKELLDEYIIKIAAPGFTRDNIIVFADKNNLLVCAAEKNADASRPEKCFQSRMRLPDNADAELAVAEYKNNILQLYIPKASRPYKTGKVRIVVY